MDAARAAGVEAMVLVGRGAYYLYVWDQDWGPAFFKLCAYAPYPMWACCDGHEWTNQHVAHTGSGDGSVEPAATIRLMAPKSMSTNAPLPRDSATEHWGTRVAFMSRVPPLTAPDGVETLSITGYKRACEDGQLSQPKPSMYDRT